MYSFKTIIIVLSSSVISLTTGCAASRFIETEPQYDQLIENNVLADNEEFNPERVAKKAHCSYTVIWSQSDLLKLTTQNTVYCIKTELNLQGKVISIPSGSLLFFDGGFFRNGTIQGNNTIVVAKNYEIFKHGIRTYKAYTDGSYKYVTKDKDTIVIGGTWLNKNCGSNWTGMLIGDTTNCASLAVNNYIRLYKTGQTIIFPKDATFYVYGRISCEGHSIDFNGSAIKSIEFNKVEDKTLVIPNEAKARPLKSLYGLVDFNADNACIKNLTIDGRASTRNEVPSLGTECLLSMASNKNCQLQNIIIKDAVGCGICSYAIFNCTFENVTIYGCGEHGIYTHTSNGALRFHNCHFINCGQDPTLFKQRGASACVKFSGARDKSFAELKNLKVYFSDCSFESDPSIYVATFYSDLPYAEFLRCIWKGGVKGYSIVSPKLAEEMDKLVELKFIECDNPCYQIRSVNTIRRLIRCKNVSNPFADSVELTDCEINVGYADVDNNYTAKFSAQYDTPVVCTRCSFIKGADDIAIRNTIISPRPMEFKHCSWNFGTSSATKYRGSHYLVLSNREGKSMAPNSVVFTDCEINLGNYRLIYCSDTDVCFDKCDYKSSYDTLVDGIAEKPNRVRVINMQNRMSKSIARHSVIIE